MSDNVVQFPTDYKGREPSVNVVKIIEPDRSTTKALNVLSRDIHDLINESTDKHLFTNVEIVGMLELIKKSYAEA